MYYLYGTKGGSNRKLVATFDSEQQLLAYVRWATLSEKEGSFKFEQGSPLVGYRGWDYAESPQSEEDPPPSSTTPRPACCKGWIQNLLGEGDSPIAPGLRKRDSPTGCGGSRRDVDRLGCHIAVDRVGVFDDDRKRPGGENVAGRRERDRLQGRHIVGHRVALRNVNTPPAKLPVMLF